MSRKREKLRKGSVRFSKFTAVGLGNAVVDIGTLNLFLWLLHTREPGTLALYNGVALVLANANSYIWNSLWTFRGRAEHSLREVVLFVLQALVNITISNALFFVLVRPIVVNTELPTYLAGNLAKVASVAVASVISFFFMRYVVFSCRRWLEKVL